MYVTTTTLQNGKDSIGTLYLATDYPWQTIVYFILQGVWH